MRQYTYYLHSKFYLTTMKYEFENNVHNFLLREKWDRMIFISIYFTLILYNGNLLNF